MRRLRMKLNAFDFLQPNLKRRKKRETRKIIEPTKAAKPKPHRKVMYLVSIEDS